MLKLGIIGMNPGNGHPYSYAAVCNGFDPEALQRDCPFALIRHYLPVHHRQQTFLPGVRVTHIWTQERALSEAVAGVAKIDHIVESPEAMAGEVDAVLFTRDDIARHHEMALPFLKARIPLYMDKVMTHDAATLARFLAAAGPDYPIMTASSFRFAPEVERLRQRLKPGCLRALHAVSPNVWVRYAPHLIDPILDITASPVRRVRAIGDDAGTTAILEHANGVVATLQVMETLNLPIRIDCFGNAPQEPDRADYTDPGLESYFTSIVRMLQEFVRRVTEHDFTRAEFERSVHLNRIVIAALESRADNGRPVDLTTQENV